MATGVAYKPVKSANDLYQSSVATNYQRDQVTGELYKTSGSNVRTIIPEQFRSAILRFAEGSANNSFTKIYTVPAGKVFILASGSLSFGSKPAASFSSNARFNISKDGGATYSTICRLVSADAVASCGNQVINPNALMVLDESWEIYVSTNSSNVQAYAQVQGYEINKSDYLGIFN